MIESIHETQRRRHIQEAYNHQHGIEPMQAISNIKNLETVKSDDNVTQDFTSLATHHTTKKLKRMTAKEKKLIHEDLKKQLDEAVQTRDFERAVMIRDQIKALVGNDEN
jgi:excinuclease ABC subunit B